MAIGIDDYRAITSAIFSAALDPLRWEGVLKRMETLVPGVRPHLVAHDGRTGEAIVAQALGYDPAYLAAYDTHFHALNAWVPGFISNPEGTVLYSYEMCAEENLLQTKFYNDWVRPQDDIRAGGGVVVAHNGESTCVIGGNIPARWRDTLEDPWIELVRQLTPALIHAWNINRQLAGGALERSLIAATSAEDPAFIITDAAGRILFQNGNAALMLARGDVLYSDMHSRLSFRQAKVQDRLEAVGGTPNSAAVGCAFGVTAPDGRNLSVRLARFDRQVEDGWDLGVYLGIRSPSILVVVTKSKPLVEATTILATRYGLTTAEVEVVIALAEGRAPREIAEERQVSLHTVRNQIRSAMEKCGVRRQTQLVMWIVAATDQARQTSLRAY